MKLVSCNSNRPLAQEIAQLLNLQLTPTNIKCFPDGEFFAEILENVRGEDVFVIQSTCKPVNDNLMELLLVLDVLKRASAQSITAVIPYFGYARQDRKVEPRTPISARLVADLISAAGTSRVLTVDLHADQIQGFFNIPLDNLTVTPLFQIDISRRFPNADIVIVSPDVGGVKRARDLANRLSAGLAIIDKRREKPGISEVMNIVGDVTDKLCILVDDIVDSGMTLCNAATRLLENGATQVHVYCTHGVLSGSAIHSITQSPAITNLVITDSINNNQTLHYHSKIQVHSIAGILAEAIRRIQAGESVSSLFYAEGLTQVLHPPSYLTMHG